MKITIDIYTSGLEPKRGDILQTNVGNRRERTCLILAVHRLRPVKGVPRYRLWAERWWELEGEFCRKLAASAERNGGQVVIYLRRYPARKRKVQVWM